MTAVLRQIAFINTAHTITHYSLVILPTAVLAMAVPGGPFGSSYGPILALATGTLSCALFFPNRKEELEPEQWTDAQPAAAE
jgi:hypothetical protein